jgi:hypothetical protein
MTRHALERGVLPGNEFYSLAIFKRIPPENHFGWGDGRTDGSKSNRTHSVTSSLRVQFINFFTNTEPFACKGVKLVYLRIQIETAVF